MQKNNSFWTQIVLAVIFLCLIFAGFFVYLQSALKTTIDRNASYISDAAAQTAKRVDDLLVGAENSISAIAYMYGLTTDPEKADVELLGELTESTIFDYIGYVSADGIYTDNKGSHADVSDRDYFRDGISGNSGMDMIFKGRLSGEDLVIFYAPVMKDGEPAGVLTGRYRQNQMRNIISTEYFDEPANTYLCLSDGTVIASSKETRPVNILGLLNNNSGADKEAVSFLEKALKEGISGSFIYKNSYGSGSAYIMKLAHSRWMMLQVFPMNATNEMLSRAYYGSTALLLWVLMLSVIYIILLLHDKNREKRKLTYEKQQMTDIVNSTSELFSGFITADLENDTYKLMSNEGVRHSGGMPEQGIFSELCGG